ncbi:NADH-quinone oxidoreductase subunit L [Methylobacter svalbardensis]|uniref:NADH-quinone oxidoreductase subunit L n=1 Tax=Methylobacter svalbardensis TaxID=3080016 RepID=UPI0030EBE568
MIELLGWIPLFPLLGFLILVLAGERLSKPLVAWVGVGCMAVSALLVALIGAEFLNGTMQPYRLVLGYWMEVDDLSIPFGFYLDALSVTMLFVVTGVGFLIHVYSAGFMASDLGYARFFAYMNLFVSAMLVLVLADNLVLLYLGWEGVGLGSYLLVGFWYEDPNNGYAARKAFVMTRIGDTALLVGLFLLFTQLHTFDIQFLMLRATSQWDPGTLLPVTAAALLLGGAVGKSAQLPLQSWLPDAMAGPTPVSALIHAATMVTAGVYLIARTNALFMMAPSVQFLVAVIGAVTLLMAGCSALVQTDIKRILAYSTISQIGYMFMALGVGAWSSAIFHLLTHAFFKALLFLAAGAVIFCFHHEHNIFKMGGLRKAMPLAFWSFMIGSAALSALPFTSGFYSKHEILLAAFEASPGLWAAGCLGAIITGIYSFRLVFVVFFGRECPVIETRLGWQMSIPLILLGALALFGGMLKIPLDSVFPALFNQDHTFDLVAVITVAAPFIGLLIAVLFYLTRTFSAQRLVGFGWINQMRIFCFNGWGMDALYDTLVVRPFKTLTQLNKNDVVDGVYTAIAFLSRRGHLMISASQTGRIRWYASSMVLGTVVVIAIGWLS